MTHAGQSSHVASCLSVADILAVLYIDVMRVDPADPTWPGRDRFILSKGHAGAAVYATLAECGFLSRGLLRTHTLDGSRLSGHVSHIDVPGVELSTGSLGHGLPVGAGMALWSHRRREGWRVFVVLSDGECDEGSNWEAALFAAHHRLDNLTVVIDYNGLQSLGAVEDTIRLEPFADKWRAFGWDAVEVDGHDHGALRTALEQPRDRRPLCVLAHTVKGKGVNFMERSVLWHYRPPNDEDLRRALEGLESG